MCQLCVCLCLFVGTQVSAGTQGGHKGSSFLELEVVVSVGT